MPPMPARSARGGMTLVELLLAIVIASLVVALVFSTYRTVHAVAAGQQQRVATRRVPADALQQLQADLMRAFDAGRPETRMILTQRLDQAAVSFCLVEPLPGETDLRWSRAVRVEWAVDGTDGRLALRRSAQPVAGPGSLSPPVTNAVAGDIARFAVQVHDGTNWTARWPPADTNVLPRLARLELLARGVPTNEAWQLDVWIPAGNAFTSSLRRTAAAAPAPAP